MGERDWERREAEARGTRGARSTRRGAAPRVESLEGRALMAYLAPIGTVNSPTTLGYQVPLDGGATNPQTYTVTSDNPAVKATIAQGQFLTINVTHASSGANDPSFTGSMTYQLFEDLTPNTVAMIEKLVSQGFYTNKIFHRVAPNFPGPTDFIIQGGSVNGNGTGSVNQPGFPFPDEFNQQLAFTNTGANQPNDVAGQLAMANAGDDTNDSQFFVTTSDPRSLDFNHTIFGQLVDGWQTVTSMTQVARGGTDGNTPLSPITITSATLSNTSPDGVVHIDTTNAAAGQSANITVTATDPSDNTKAIQTFRVNVTPNNDSNGQPIIERPFLNPVLNQVVGLVSASPVQGQTAVFQLTATAPTPNDPLTYTVKGGITTGTSGKTFTNVQNATATVDSNGVVTVVPNAGFTGVINLLVGVRDNTNRAGTSDINSPDNFDTQAITLTVINGQIVNEPPIALNGTATAVANRPSPIQLKALTGNPQAPLQTLTYTIVTQPQQGTISQFDATKGTFLYTPNGDFQGTDTVQFRVRDVGEPTPNLDSNTATETITVGGGDTGAVRLIGNVLVVTPLPRTDSVPNTIDVTQSAGNIQVRVNGLIDAIQPAATSLDRIVVYGSKESDKIRVADDVTVPSTLDGGHGGANSLNAGGGDSREHGWFGYNVMTGGTGNDTLIGRKGQVKFKASPGYDTAFAGVPRRPQTQHRAGKPMLGQYYRFVGKRLQPIPQPYFPQPARRRRTTG